MNDTRLKLMEAIARRRMVTAQYNGNRMTLAPHLMFERRGDLFVSALNLGKNWRSEDERRLGYFKLDGLAAAELLEDGFDPLPCYDAATPHIDDKIGRAHVRPPVTNAHLVCRLLLEKKTKHTNNIR